MFKKIFWLAALFLPPVVYGQLPLKAENVLQKLEAYKIETRTEAEKRIKDKTEATIVYLQKQLVETTKTGDLDSANRLSDTILELKAQIGEAQAPAVEPNGKVSLKRLRDHIEMTSSCDGGSSFFSVTLRGKQVYRTTKHAFVVLTLGADGSLQSERTFGLEGSPGLRPKLSEYVDQIPKDSLVVFGVSGTTRHGDYGDVISLVGGDTTHIGYCVPYFLLGVRGARSGAIEASGEGPVITSVKTK